MSQQERVKCSNVKRQKTHGAFTRRTNNSIPNIIGISFDEHMSLVKSSTLSTNESNQIGGDLTIDKPPNAYDEVVVSTVTFNTQNAGKEQRSTEQSDHHDHSVAQSFSDQKHIDELPVELLMDVFDYLSIGDLCAIRQTSRRWRQIAGYCFQRNYSSIIRLYKPGRNLFTQLTRRICIYEDDFQHFLEKKPNFQQLRSINLGLIDLTSVSLDGINETLCNVEHLEIRICKTNKDLVDNILALTKNLKRLTVCQYEIGNEWFDRKYPTLESLAFLSKNTNHFMPIVPFLENNPNIREFGINSSCLWENRNSMQTIKETLDVLYVYVDEKVESSAICLMLNELHELGIYKRFELYRYGCGRHITNNDLASLKCLLRLCMNFPIVLDNEDNVIDPDDEPVELKSLQSLQVFHINTTSSIKDIETAATNLQNLERIYADYANFSHIVSFVKKSAKLKEIIVESFDNLGYFESFPNYVDSFGFLKNAEREPKFIDLYMLNRERSKVPDAERITLYVQESLFLATKWTIRDTDLQYVRIKRIESFEKYHGQFNESIEYSF